MIKLRFKSAFLKSSNKFIFYNFFIIFYNLFFIYKKMSKNLSAKCYQQNKERLQKNLVKDINIFLKQKKENIRKFFRAGFLGKNTRSF